MPAPGGVSGCFFGTVVRSGVPASRVDVPEGLLLHLSAGSIAHDARGPASALRIAGCDGEGHLLCTLLPGACVHAALDVRLSAPFWLEVRS
eukprot:gene33194-21637_t